MSSAKLMERVVIDLTIDDDEGGGGLVGEESELEEEESSLEESSDDEESGFNEDEDGNNHYRDQLMNSEQSFIVPYGKGCKNAGGSLYQLQGLYTSYSSER